MTGWNETKADFLGLVEGWLSDENNGQWRMVVDNADNADFMFEPWHGGTSTKTTTLTTDHSLSDYLPSSPSGSIVITSRSRVVVEGLVESSEDIFDVGPMEAELAETLLVKKLKKSERGAVLDDVVRLIRHLYCMPLAITQAAAYINQRAPRMTVSRYIVMLENNDGERAKLLRRGIRDPRRDGQASNSIICTWLVTFEHLRQTRDSAARLLALMSLFDREAIPDHLLQGRYLDYAGGENEFEEDVVLLRAYSLVGVSVCGTLFDMHRLVQLSTKIMAPRVWRAEAVARTIYRHYGQDISDMESRQLANLQGVIPARRNYVIVSSRSCG